MLLKSSFYTILASVLQFGISLITGMVIARTLGPEGKGAVYLVVQYASLGGLMLSFGLGTSYLYHLRKRDIGRNEIMTHAACSIAVVAGICLVAFCLALPTLSHITGGTLDNPLLRLMLVLLVLNISTQFSGGILMNEALGVQQASAYGMIGGVGYLAALLIALLWFHLGVMGAVIATLIPPTIRVGLAVRVLLRAGLPVLTWRALNWTKVLLTYGMGSFFGNIMMTTACRVDAFVINALIGPAPLGVYSVAVSLAELTLMVPAAVGVALFPHLTSQSAEDRLATASLIARLSACLGLFSAVALGIFAYPVIALVFGQKFIGAYRPLLALLPGLIAMTTAYGYANYFSSIGWPLANAAVFGLGMLFNVGISIIVVPHYGIVGAACVTSLTYVICMVSYILLISRTAKVPWNSLLVPRRSDWELIKAQVTGHRLWQRFIAWKVKM